MRSRLVVLTGFLAATTLTVGLTRPTVADPPNNALVGKKIDDIKFTAPDGKSFSLYELKGKKAIVLVFLSFECPVSTSYSQPLADIAGEYQKQGVAFVGLTTNQDETQADVAKHAREFNVGFPVVLDTKFKAADAVKADITPEVFVLDENYVLRYRGRIDNGYYARLKKNPQITKHDLRQVLSEIVTGRPVSVASTEPIGCPITRETKAAPKVGNVTYYKDVLPILRSTASSVTAPVRSARSRS